MKNLILTAAILFMCYSLTYAQYSRRRGDSYGNWTIGINTGITNFRGEYNMFRDASFNSINHWSSNKNFGFGAIVKKNFSEVFSLELGWNYSILSGSKLYDYSPIPDFNTNVNEFDLYTVWNINNLFSMSKFDCKINWYAKVGLGATHLKNVSATSPQNNQHWKIPNISVGTGVEYNLNDRLKLNIGTQWSRLNTNRLDEQRVDINSGYTDFVVIGSKLYTHAGISGVFTELCLSYFFFERIYTCLFN